MKMHFIACEKFKKENINYMLFYNFKIILKNNKNKKDSINFK